MPGSGLIPIADREYSQLNEQTMRNSVEQELQDVSVRIRRNESKQTKSGTLAIRRFQFMFMGGGNV
tara:strand:+ start:2128 stop:2325 length:198 start_codon:yes stop_codon:yes gene_type:complete